MIARWTSPEWHARTREWIHAELDGAGRTVTGPIEQPRVRHWSTQLTIPTDRGRVWFKEAHPAEAFEGPLLAALNRLAPDRVLPILAVHPVSGAFLADDQGPTLRSVDGDRLPHWLRVVREYAQLQVALSPYGDDVLACGVSLVAPADLMDIQAHLVDTIAGLRADHPLRVDAQTARHLMQEAAPRLREAGAALADGQVPLSLEHSDLHDGNAFVPVHSPTDPGAPLRFFDFGDAVWGHPFASLFIPIRELGQEGARDWRTDPELTALIEAYLEPWTLLAPREELRRLIAPAITVANLHRAISWVRILSTPPPDDPSTMATHVPWILDCLAARVTG